MCAVQRSHTDLSKQMKSNRWPTHWSLPHPMHSPVRLLLKLQRPRPPTIPLPGTLCELTYQRKTSNLQTWLSNEYIGINRIRPHGPVRPLIEIPTSLLSAGIRPSETRSDIHRAGMGRRGLRVDPKYAYKATKR